MSQEAPTLAKTEIGLLETHRESLLLKLPFRDFIDISTTLWIRKQRQSDRHAELSKPMSTESPEFGLLMNKIIKDDGDAVDMLHLRLTEDESGELGESTLGTVIATKLNNLEPEERVYLINTLSTIINHYKGQNENDLRDLLGLLELKTGIDAMTGLLNRNGMIQEMAKFAERLSKEGEKAPKKVAVFAWDIDHFKTVNDSFGHSNGDTYLKTIATKLSKLFRKSDIVCRWGGEEFTVILPTESETEDITEIGVGKYQAVNEAIHELLTNHSDWDQTLQKAQQEDRRNEPHGRSVSAGIIEVNVDALKDVLEISQLWNDHRQQVTPQVVESMMIKCDEIEKNHKPPTSDINDKRIIEKHKELILKLERARDEFNTLKKQFENNPQGQLNKTMLRHSFENGLYEMFQAAYDDVTSRADEVLYIAKQKGRAKLAIVDASRPDDEPTIVSAILGSSSTK